MTSDPWARYRSLIRDGLEQAAADIDFTHAQLVREQLSARTLDEELVPAILCLRMAESIGANAESALPGATALALLAEMATVFLSLTSGHGGPSLSTAWGMPRTLNAGDAFFAAAHHAILADPQEISGQSRLQAAAILDDATKGLMEMLNAGGEGVTVAEGSRTLLPAALLLAGVYAGADDGTVQALKRLGASWQAMSQPDLANALGSDLRSALAATA
ncbi:MAG TPA: hypothetical protein VFX19_10345 [Dehalococcoidia bacterium]|jgi:hypothetical protein|nr:hypothetical protein [Dehalococcoidia bacterium]